MAKIYERQGRSKLYAHVKIWNESLRAYRWDRIATGTSDAVAALKLAEALEKASEQLKPLASSTITKEHVSSLLKTIIASAGVEIEGDIQFPLFREIADKYMERVKNKVSQSTFKTYSTKYNTIKEWIRDEAITVDFFTEDKCEDFYAHLLELSSNKTANETMRHLGRILGLVVPKILPYNPLTQVKLAPNKGHDVLDRTPLSLDEVYLIVAGLTKTDRQKEFRLATIISASTSCRMTDAVTMNSENLKDGIVTYRQHKTKKTVSIPIVNKLWLKELKLVKGDFCPDLKAEWNARGTATMSSEYTQLITKLGIDQKYKIFEKSKRKVAKKTFHSLRHTLRTELIKNGATSEIADMITGHSGNQGKTYTHTDLDSMKKHLKSVFD